LKLGKRRIHGRLQARGVLASRGREERLTATATTNVAGQFPNKVPRVQPMGLHDVVTDGN